MSAAINSTASPPLRLIAPFFLSAPLGLIAAGALIATSSHDVFVGINIPRTVAITHALAIGWITTTVMGASYQFGPAVVGGRLLSIALARAQYVLHVVAVPAFVWALIEWNTALLAVAGVLLAASFALYATNLAVSVARGTKWTLPRAYLAVSLTMLGITAGAGLSFALATHYLWFPVTMGRLAAHAHLGLVGWLGITFMGLSYQLVPMFNVVNRVHPRFGWVALALTVVSTLTFALVMLGSPSPVGRVGIAVLLAAGPALWGADQLRLMRGRSRRKLDVQGRATFASLGFLVLAILAGLAAAAGSALTPDDEPARLLLAYGAFGVVGWLGLAAVGNSYKIVPFLVWNDRYRPLAGREPVPTIAEIYNETAANGVLILIAVSTLLLAAGAVTGELGVLRAGGLTLAAAGTIYAGSLVAMFIPRSAASGVPQAHRVKPL